MNLNGHIPQQATTIYKTLLNICTDSADNSLETIPTARYNETDGLITIDDGTVVSVGVDTMRSIEPEELFVQLLHSVTQHTDQTNANRPGSTDHGRLFWNAYQHNLTKILNDETAKRVIAGLCQTTDSTFDWNRAQYRAVQHIDVVDGRSETIQERKEKLAAGIGYTGYDDFENPETRGWNFAFTPEQTEDTNVVKIDLQTTDYLDTYTDGELLKFINEHNGEIPLPQVCDINQGDEPPAPNKTFLFRAEWKPDPTDTEDCERAIALQQRLGYEPVAESIPNPQPTHTGIEAGD